LLTFDFLGGIDYLSFVFYYSLLGALMRFSMALKVPPDELAITRPADQVCSKHLSVVNDIWSYEKEYIASQTLHDEGGVLCTCVASKSNNNCREISV